MKSEGDLTLLLYLIDAAGKIEGRKRLQKMVCIAKNKDKIPFTFRFRPYFYGPYSEELSNSIDSLCGAGLVEEERFSLTDDIYQYRYFLTDKGREAIKEKSDTRTKLVSVVRKMNDLETKELVRIAKQLEFN